MAEPARAGDACPYSRAIPKFLALATASEQNCTDMRAACVDNAGPGVRARITRLS